MILCRRSGLSLLCLLAGACIDGGVVGDLPGAPVVDAAPAPDVERLAACTAALDCPAPSSPELASICGQLYDVSSRAPLTADQPIGDRCDPMNPTVDGPCSVCPNAYAPDALVVDPGDAVALDSERIDIDDCGRFRMIDVAPPPDGNVALLVGNCNPVANTWAPTAVSLRTTPEMLVSDQRLFATARATDAMWTESAGFPFGTTTYTERGAVLATFTHESLPQAGVTLTVNGRPLPLATHYFDDVDGGDLKTLDMDLQDTGATGSALAVGTSFVLHGGTGAEPFGCIWPAEMAASIPGVLFVQYKRAVSAPTGDQCHHPGISGNLR